MNELMIFNNPEFGAICAVEKDGEPWFVAADVCRALEIGETHVAMRRLDDDEKCRCSIPTPGGEQKVSIVNEPGLYSLVLGSRKPEAKAFKRWIIHEVIPSIRGKTDDMSPVVGVSGKVTCAQRIRQGLEMRNMTQKELCEKTGIPKSAMSQYCSGAFEPKQKRTALIAQALNVSEGWLMGYEEVNQMKRQFSIADYKEALRGAGPKLKEIILERATQDDNIDFPELKELVDLAYPEPWA